MQASSRIGNDYQTEAVMGSAMNPKVRGGPGDQVKTAPGVIADSEEVGAPLHHWRVSFRDRGVRALWISRTSLSVLIPLPVLV